MGILGGSDIERIGDFINKSSVSLDQFVGGKLICKGFVGTKITLSGVAIKYAFGAPLEIYITENSKQYENSDVLKYEVAVLPMGAFSYRVEYQDYDVSYNGSFLSPSTIVLAYNFEKVIFENGTPGVYSLEVPSGVTTLVIDAVGGGGGGTYAPAHPSGTSGDGGRGGRAGSFLQNSTRAVTSPATISITIGAGGAGGTVNRSTNQGTPPGTGGSTVISGGGLGTTGITLAGGTALGSGTGGIGKSNTLKETGNLGTKGYSSGTGEYAIVGGDGGYGGGYGSTSSGGGGGGGGDGSPFGQGGQGGQGGDGGGSSNSSIFYGRLGYNGTKGSGGGGGGGTGGEMSMSALGGDGGKGGDGYVRIKSRISV